MPHLAGDGSVSESWLLRQACHLHWQSIAATAGAPISSLRDADGHRALPSIISARIDGDTAAFAEDDKAILTLTSLPSAATGWRSRTMLRKTNGATISVDLVSRFARRDGSSNIQLQPAGRIQGLPSAPARDLPKDVKILNARRRSLAFAALDASPLVSLRVDGSDLNGVGLLYFANFMRFFSAAEAATAGPIPLPAASSRDLHWYGNADAGDTLDLSCDLSVTELGLKFGTVATITARRQSDGVLVAISEVRRGGE
ncbi:MAG: LnmK family bifunctional acyltransferase/decarboxylase [Pseudomonadota bacterium]